MKSRIRFAIGVLASLLAVALIFGLSIRSVSDQHTATEPLNLTHVEVVPPDTAEQWVADPVVDDLLAEMSDQGETFNAGYSELVDPVQLDELDFDDVRDVQIDGNQLLLATAGGLIEYFPADSSFAVYSFPQGIEDYDCRAVLRHEGITLIGTSAGLYCIDQLGDVGRVWEEIADTVTTLDIFDDKVFVGTASCGLYTVMDDIVENILPDKSIVAVSDDYYGLWVVTREDGLLFDDGEGWRSRFLLADTTAFAQASTLESAFQRLWVGTPKGVYIYDGGGWELLAVGDGEVGTEITSIARGKGFIYFGTATSGVYSYYAYDGSLLPLPFGEHLEVTSLAVSAGRYLVGTEDGAIFKTPQRELHIHDLFNQRGDLASAW